MRRSSHSALISIVAAALCALLLTTPSSAQTNAPYGKAPYHIENRRAEKVTAVLGENDRCTDAAARHCWVYVPYAPDLESQRDVVETMQVVNKGVIATSYQELSPQKRLLLRAEFDDSSSFLDLTSIATIKATLYSRTLVPGPPKERVDELTSLERFEYTQATPDHDYKSPTFQQWLTANGLRRYPNERDLNFARRVFDCIRANYTYQFDRHQNRHPSYICTINWTDCCGLSDLFVSALRANGIPAVTLLGHLAASSGPNDHEQCHVKSQFYADGIGWVPVEMSGAVSNKARPAADYFGHQGGNFIALAMDSDVYYDTGLRGVQEYTDLQDFALWFRGSGDYSTNNRTVMWEVVVKPV